MPIENLFTPSGRRHRPQTGIVRGGGGMVGTGGGMNLAMDPMSLLNSFFGLKERYDSSQAEDVVVKKLQNLYNMSGEQATTLYNNLGPEKSFNLANPTLKSEAAGIVNANAIQGIQKNKPVQPIIPPTGQVGLGPLTETGIKPENAQALEAAGGLVNEDEVTFPSPLSPLQQAEQDAQKESPFFKNLLHQVKKSPPYEGIAKNALEPIDKTRSATPSDFLEYEGKSLAMQEIPEFRNPISGDIATSAGEIEANKLLWEDPSSMRIARDETSIREDILLRKQSRIALGRLSNVPSTDLLGNRLAGDAGFPAPLKFSADVVEYLAANGIRADQFDTTNPIHVATLAQGGGNNTIFSPFFRSTENVLKNLDDDAKEYYMSKSVTQVAEWKKQGQVGADLMHKDFAEWLGARKKIKDRLASATNTNARIRILFDEKNDIRNQFVNAKKVKFFKDLQPLVAAARVSTKGTMRDGKLVPIDKGVQDITLVKALNKFIEPNSAVLGQEFDQIFRALATPDQLKAWLEQAISGGLKLRDKQRQSIIDFGMNLEAELKSKHVFPEIDRAKSQLDFLNSHLSLGDSTIETTDVLTGKKTKDTADMRVKLRHIVDPKLLEDWTIYKASLVKSVKK